MLVNTKHFGRVTVDDDKILHFDNGIIGFEELKKFALMYDVESDDSVNISWLQSLDDKDIAITVIDPLIVIKDYKPIVDDELFSSLGNPEDELVILTTLTVPSDLKNMSINLKAPIIINLETKKGCQAIVENQEYKIKYMIYDILEELKNMKAGE